MYHCIKKYLLLALTICLFFTSYSQESATKGKLFWYGYMESIAINKLKLYITYSDKSSPTTKYTSITVGVPGQLWDKNYSLKNHEFLEIDVPEIYGYVNTDNHLDNRAVKIVSTENIEVRIAITSNESMDATTIIPLKYIEKAPSYIVNTYTGSSVNKSQVLLIAPEKNTKVEIIPSVELQSGKKANIPYTITMLAGGTYQFKAKGSESLTGTTIKVIDGCEKLLAFSGNECSNVSNNAGCSGCDQLLSQLMPISTLQKSYVVVPFKNTTAGNYFEILSPQDGNEVYIDGIFDVTLNKGESKRYDEAIQKVTFVTSSKKLQVVQFMKSGSCLGEINGLGDPSMINLSGFYTNTKSASVKAPHTTNVRTHWITAITKTVNIPLFKFDKTAVTANFNLLNPGSSYSIAHFSVDDDIHFIESDSGFYAIGYGYGKNESYAYSITQEFEVAPYSFKLDLENLCIGNKPIEFSLKGDSVLNAFWDFGPNVKDTGLRVYYLPSRDSIKHKVSVIIQNKNNSCPLDTVIKNYTILKAPKIDLGPKDTTICIGERIAFSVTQLNKTYLWGNGSKSGNYFTTKTEKITVQVTDINGCTSYDTINVNVVACEDSSSFIPNVMTPNGDGLNDEFYVSHFGYNKVEGKIINRWGQIVYKFTLPENKHWNGRLNNTGDMCPAGTYFYVLTLKESSNKSDKTVNGIITLITKE